MKYSDSKQPMIALQTKKKQKGQGQRQEGGASSCGDEEDL